MRMGSGFWRFEGSESKTGNPDEWKMLTNDHGTRTEGEGKTSRHKRSTMILTLPENMLQLAVASSATARPPSPVGLLTHAIARIPSTKAATSTLRDTVPSPAKPRAASPIGLVAQAVARIPSLKQGEWKVRVIADREEASYPRVIHRTCHSDILQGADHRHVETRPETIHLLQSDAHHSPPPRRGSTVPTLSIKVPPKPKSPPSIG